MAKRKPKAKSQKQVSDIVESLINNAFEILDFRAKLALGKYEELPENYIRFDQDEQNIILTFVKPLIATATATKKVEATTAKEVITMLSKGKISTQEATTFMELLKSKTEIEEKEVKLNLQKSILSITEDN